LMLYQIQDPAHLTLDYLRVLIDDHLGAADRGKIRKVVAEMLCNHIVEISARDPVSKERLASIRSLALYPSVRGWTLLQELGRVTWTPFARREPGAVRKLARSIMKEYQAA
jgi:hypothetical protein